MLGMDLFCKTVWCFSLELHSHGNKIFRAERQIRYLHGKVLRGGKKRLSKLKMNGLAHCCNVVSHRGHRYKRGKLFSTMLWCSPFLYGKWKPCQGAVLIVSERPKDIELREWVCFIFYWALLRYVHQTDYCVRIHLISFEYLYSIPFDGGFWSGVFWVGSVCFLSSTMNKGAGVHGPRCT